MKEELFKLVINNMSGIAIFFIAILLIIREIFTFITNEKRRKSDKWIDWGEMKEIIVRTEKNQMEFMRLIAQLTSYEQKTNEEILSMFQAKKECNEKMDTLIKQLQKYFNE